MLQALPPRGVPILRLGLEETTFEVDEAPQFEDTTKRWRGIGAHFHNDFPVHHHESVLPLFESERLHCWITIFEWLVRWTESSNGFRNL